jgi:hypothetical protein
MNAWQMPVTCLPRSWPPESRKLTLASLPPGATDAHQPIQENAKLKKLLAEAALDIEVLKEINSKKW